MKQLLIAVMAAVIGIVAGNILLEKMSSKPRLVYSLSDAVPLPDQSNRKVQQVTIVNRGERAAKGIELMIEGARGEYEVQESSPSDIYTGLMNDDGLKLTYEKLNPESKFTITMYTFKSATGVKSVFEGGVIPSVESVETDYGLYAYALFNVMSMFLLVFLVYSLYIGYYKDKAEMKGDSIKILKQKVHS